MSSTDLEPEAATRPTGSMRASGRRFGDSLFSTLSIGSGLLIFLTLAAVAVFLTTESVPAVVASREFSGTAECSLVEDGLPPGHGPAVRRAASLVIAIPLSIGLALFISPCAPRRMAAGLGYMIDLLAAVPSVVYGLWGGIWLVPKLEPLYLFLTTYLGWIPLFGGEPTAPMRNLASAAVVLAVMVLPIITAVSREVFLQTPRLQEEAALALGATRWETIRTVVLPFG